VKPLMDSGVLYVFGFVLMLKMSDMVTLRLSGIQ